MEIILKEDVIGLGYKHDIVNVKPGYGRNYLIPQGKGVIASESAKKQLAEELKQKAKKLEKIKADAEALAAKLEGVALTIVAKVSSNGTIYGSVNNVQIADELSKLGFDIDRKLISIKDVKTVGEHKALIRLHKEVSVVIPVTVVADGPVEAPVEAPAAPVVDEVAEGIREDGTVHDSLNHYSYGAISGWLLSGVAGIDYDFEHIVIKPVPHKSLGFVRASYDSPKGLIISEWQYESDTDSFSYHIVVPDGVNATIKLPDGRCEEVCGGDYKY